MRATAVIIKDMQVLLIHRVSKGDEYYVLPGGSVEKDENLEEATAREVLEETNLNIYIDRKLWIMNDDYDNRTHHFFLVTKFNGNLMLSGPESLKNSIDDQYKLEWHDIDKLHNLLIYPKGVGKKISTIK